MMRATTWSDRDHPYGVFLDAIQRPARYLGGEYGSTRKPWDSTPVHVALAFPDLYEIGMSHLGLRILYGSLNDDPRIACERVFAPWKDLEGELRKRGLPLVSLENARPLGDFDVIGFSLQHELTFTNVLNMLDLAGLPLRSADRDGRHPLVVAGGPVAMQPEPLAPFIDAFVIGDGERSFPRLVLSHERWRGEGRSREEILVRLARLGGVYCPSLYATDVEPLTGHVVVGKPIRDGVPPRVERQIVPDLDRHPFPSAGPVPNTEVVFDRFSLEIARGCTEGCRFCQAGVIYRPVRERSPAEILATLESAVRESGYDDVSLTALSTADSSSIAPLVPKLMARLREEKVSLAVSSLRAYGLPESLLDAIAAVRNTNLTFAPEAGSSRLRDVINKNVSDEDMERTAHAVFSRGWKRCKLYFMIGLPTEEDADVVEIVRTAARYLEIGRRYHGGKSPAIVLSVSNYVPKAHTPFQWVAMDGIDEIERKHRLLQREADRARFQLKWHDAGASCLEGILSRGDRRIADLVERAFRAGCRLDGWSQEFQVGIWMECLRDLGIDAGAYLGERPLDARLPWDHIDVGVTTDFLRKEHRRALDGQRSPPCGKPLGAKVHATSLEEAEADTRKLVCFHCGLQCDMARMREERLSFLRQLDAHRDDAAKCGGVAVEDLAAIQSRNRRPRTAIVNKQARRVRLLFSKLGRARFLSHLDLVRLLPRLIRRAGLSMSYSLGFHPKPRMAFSPALRLGWGSQGEFLEVHLEGEAADEGVLLGALNGASPEGLSFLAARWMDEGDPGLSRVLQVGDYSVLLPEGSPSSEVLQERRSVLLAGEPLELVRQRGGVEERRLAEPGRICAIRLEASRQVFMRIRVDLPRVPRPEDVAAFLSGFRPAPQAVDRVALWALDSSGSPISPLDLDRLRTLSRPSAPGGCASTL